MGAAHPRVDALGSAAVGEGIDEPFDTQVRWVVGFQDGGEIRCDDTSGAPASSEPFGLGAAVRAIHDWTGDPCAVAADAAAGCVQARKKPFGGALRADAEGSDGLGEAGAANGALGPVDPDLCDLAVAPIAVQGPGAARPASLLLRL